MAKKKTKTGAAPAAPAAAAEPSYILSVLPASACAEQHADWLEYCALRDPGSPVSTGSFKKQLKITGSVDALDESDDDEDDDEDETDESDKLEALADAAFAELGERETACESEGRYPFELDKNTLKLKPDGEKSVYAFLLLLSLFGKDAGPPGQFGARIFEKVSALSLNAYLGGRHDHVYSYVFGFPRSVLPAGYAAALDDFCARLGECDGNKGHVRNEDQKDAGLDVVAWRRFADDRRGKLIAFGQCATGDNWREKQFPATIDWCGLWLRSTPYVTPIRTFFVPHRLDYLRDWEWACRLGGVVFDRCRITQLAVPLIEDDLKKEIEGWTGHVVDRVRLGAKEGAA